MSSVDERIVRMSFDNGQFQANISATMASLDALNKSLKLQGATKGLQDIGQAAGNVKLDAIGSAVEAIKNKFSSLSLIGITALTNIANKAVDAGTRMLKSFTIEPISAGFKNYETQINAVQTIMANTGLKGSAGLKEVTKTLDQLNDYANKTIYSFAEMAKNVGTFTAAGVKLDVASNAIKGIANLAALSGSNSDQASSAMYQLSQAIAANKVGLQDWNSVMTAGLGGGVFQKALFDTGTQLGTINKTPIKQTFEQWTASGNSFRNSLQSGWVTGKVLTETLSKFTGDLTDAQLKAKGYNADQIKQIQEIAKTAKGAATNIKTYSQLTAALKEEVASAYANVFKSIFGDINGATKMFTALHNVAQAALTGPIVKLNDIIVGFNQAGGRPIALDLIKTALKDLNAVITPIKEAFRDIFPAATSNTLLGIVKGLDSLVHGFKMGAETAGNLKSTFRGVFAVFDILWQVIKQTAEFLGSLIARIGGGATGKVLAFTGSIGDMIVNFDKAIRKGQGLAKFFMALEGIILPVVSFIKQLGSAIGNALSNVPGLFDKLGNSLSGIPKMLGPLANKIGDFFRNMFAGLNFQSIGNVLAGGLAAGVIVGLLKLKNAITGLFGGAGNPITGIVQAITAPFHSLTETLESMQKTLQATTLIEIAAAVGILTFAVIGLSKIDQAGLDRATQALTLLFLQLFTSLALFSRIGGLSGFVTTGAGLILLASAIRILVGAVKGLSELSWPELEKGLGALAAILLELSVTTKLMAGQNAGMLRTGAALILLSVAIRILVTAVQEFSKMSWGEVAKGLTGVAALLISLSLFTKFTEANKGGLASGAGLILLAAAMKILASAAGDFAKMEWGQIAKGLTSISAILLAVGVFSKTVGNPVTLIASGASLIAIGYAMTVLSKALDSFGSMSWGNIGKSLTVFASSLLLVSLALNLIPPDTLASAAALVVVAYAMVELNKAMQGFGSMSWGEIAKGLTVMAASLILIGVATAAMTEALPGAAAILVVSYAMTVLTQALAVAGAMSWEAIGKSMVVLAGSFIIFGIAGVGLAPVAPILLVLSAALVIFGAGVALTGIGVAALSVGLTGLAVSGAAGAAAFTSLILSVVKALPLLVTALGATLVAIFKAVTNATPQFVVMSIALITGLLKAVTTLAPRIIAAFVQLVNELLNALLKNIPSFADKATRIIMAILTAVQANAPRVISAFISMVITALNSIAAQAGSFVGAAINLIVAFINGISSRIGQVVSAGVNLISNFIQGIASGSVRLVNQAAEAVISFMNGVAGAISAHSGEFGAAGGEIAGAIASGLISGLAGAVGSVVDAAVNLAKSALNGAKHFLGMNSPSKEFIKVGQAVGQGFAIGMAGSKATVIKGFTTMNNGLKTGMAALKKDVDAYTRQLYALQTAHTKNTLAIYLTGLALSTVRNEYAKTAKAYADLNAGNDAQYKKLQTLGAAYDAITPKIASANDALKAAIKTRDDYAKSIKDEFSALPDIDASTDLAKYVQDVQYQLNDVKKFNSVLAQLRKLGLNDALYQQLLTKGPASLGFAEQLLAGGAGAVKNIDTLQSQLDAASADLGKAAGAALYQAGVNSAQGLVDGLKKQQAAISAQMSVIAAAMVAKIKKDLGIRSPSRVFNQLGQFVVKGLAGGLKDSTQEVVNAAGDVGKSTLDAMKMAMSDGASLLGDTTNLNPVIAPVVDLSNVVKSTGQLDALLGNKQLDVTATFASAKVASAGLSDNIIAALAQASNAGPDSAPVEVTFIQNNSSPKALTTAEIYRQTNNQLSRVRGAVTPNAT